jgi:hypothetical protein
MLWSKGWIFLDQLASCAKCGNGFGFIGSGIDRDCQHLIQPISIARHDFPREGCVLSLMKNETMINLNTQAWSRSFYFAIILALLLFISAGTIRYWQAWGYLILFFGASIGITIYLMKNDPALLLRRMHAGPRAEKSKTQKIIMLCAMASFVAILLVSALD